LGVAHREVLDLQLLVRRHHQHRHPPPSAEIVRRAEPAVLRASSTSTPSTPNPAHTRARTSASFSPIPAVNTTASSRPSAAA
jgi:hypothetical protein